MSAISAPASPVSHAFSHIQWDALTSLRLTAQETALLRMAETNPIDYTLADSRDASMYARVLLKLLAEACSAGAGTGTYASDFILRPFCEISSYSRSVLQAKYPHTPKSAQTKKQWQPWIWIPLELSPIIR